MTSLVGDTLNAEKQSDILLKNYAEPEVSLAEGKKPYNFVYVYLESAERTYFDEAVFGPIAQPLKELETKGFSTKYLLQVKDTGWTAAGVTASQCGVPLSSIGLMSWNDFGITSEFLTSATCMGDLLEGYGYDLTSIQGTEISFAGMKNLFGKHGFQTITGYHTLKELYPNRRKHSGDNAVNEWGYADDTVFQAGMDTLVNAQSKSKPFGIVLATMGGHSPNGTFSPDCEKRPELISVKTPILRANYCTNLLLQDFLQEAGERDLLENTIVIVQSDHLTWETEVSSLLEKGERTDFFAIIGPNVPVAQNTMPASMMDVYPTVLEALGFDVANRKAGLGVSLLSSEQTLVSMHGLEQLNTMISQDTMLTPLLWAQRPKSELTTGSNK